MEVSLCIYIYIIERPNKRTSDSAPLPGVYQLATDMINGWESRRGVEWSLGWTSCLAWNPSCLSADLTNRTPPTFLETPQTVGEVLGMLFFVCVYPSLCVDVCVGRVVFVGVFFFSLFSRLNVYCKTMNFDGLCACGCWLMFVRMSAIITSSNIYIFWSYICVRLIV